MKLLVIATNVTGWPVIQLSISALFLRLPSGWFGGESWLTRERGFERDGLLYRRFRMMQRWKGLLPDGASWLGGRPKRNVASRTLSELSTFASETRRAEIAHWCMLLCTPLFFLWNPRWACVVMTVYGITANLPCILVQRANRIKVDRILRRSGTHVLTRNARVEQVVGS